MRGGYTSTKTTPYAKCTNTLSIYQLSWRERRFRNTAFLKPYTATSRTQTYPELLEKL